MSPGIRSNARPGTSLPGLFLLAAARPHLLLPAWLAALTGAALGPSAGQTIAPSHILAGVACWSLTLLAVNLVNLLTDQASDLANGKNLAWRGVVGPDLLGATAAGASSPARPTFMPTRNASTATKNVARPKAAS